MKSVATSHESEIGLPSQWAWLFRAFRWYCSRYVRKHFHALRLSKLSSPLPVSPEPALIVMNHPSWWDPLVAFILSGQWKDRIHYGAIDATALRQYKLFKRLGFVGVDTSSLRGAVEFLRVGQSILSRPQNLLWVTPQGRFADVRDRPLQLKSGVGRLASRLTTGFVIPLAIEYVFWNERTPEILAQFGNPISIDSQIKCDGRHWNLRIEEALQVTLDQLSHDARSRDLARFDTLVSGRTGVGGVYDLWRRFRATLAGKRAQLSHEDRTDKERL